VNKLTSLPESLCDLRNLKILFWGDNSLGADTKKLLKKLRKKGMDVRKQFRNLEEYSFYPMVYELSEVSRDYMTGNLVIVLLKKIF